MDALNSAYTERAQVIAALSKIFPSWLNKPTDEWEGFDYAVYIKLPTGQVSWHISNNDLHFFDHLERDNPLEPWDGHSTEEKYRRLNALAPGCALPKADTL